MKPTHARAIRAVPIDPRAAPAGRPVDPRLKSLLSPELSARNPWLRCNYRGDPHFYFWPAEDEYGEPIGSGAAEVGIVRGGEVVVLDRAVENAGSYALSPDGSCVLFLTSKDDRVLIDMVDVATEETTRLANINPKDYDAHGWPGTILWLDETSFAFDDSGVIFAFRLGEETPFATLRAEGKLHHAALGGKLLVTGGKAPNKTRLVAVRDSSLELLKNLKQNPPRHLYERDGRVVLDFTPGTFELLGLRTAVEERGAIAPPRVVDAGDDPLGFVPCDPRNVLEAMHSEPNAFGRLALADGRSLVFREVEEGSFTVSIREGETEHEIDLKLWYAGASRPIYALAPDERSVLVRQGNAVWMLDLKTREQAKLGELPSYRRHIVHLGNAVLAANGKASISLLDEWSLEDVELNVQDLAAFQGGRVVIGCRESGTNGPPESDVFVRTGMRFERVGTLPIGIDGGWTSEGRDYVACWHGNAVYELPNLARLLE